MKKMSLAFIVNFIAAPLCATSAPSAITAAPVVSAKKTTVVATPIVDVSVAVPLAASALPSPSLFGGARVTIGGEYDVNFPGSHTASFNKPRITGVAVPSRMGKVSFELGYTKVLGNNVILGGAVFGAYVPKLTVDSGSEMVWLNDDGAVKETRVIDDGTPTQTLGREWLGGFRLNAGMVVMPNVAVKLIGELSAGKYFLDTVALKSSSKKFLFSEAIGAGLDVAVTDCIVFGIGAKYNLVPKTFDASSDRAPTFRIYNFGKSMSIFAEIGYRL